MTTTVHPAIAHRTIVTLKALYLYTLVGSGAIGLWMIVAPNRFLAAFGVPETDLYLLGVVGAVYATFAICSLFGLHAPLRFAPVLLFQLLYKITWLALVFAPHALRGGAPGYAWLLAAVFASYVVFDLLALPFSQLASADDPPSR